MHYNMVNEMMSAEISSTNPVVGMCGTMFCGTDRWPYVVTEVLSNKKIRVAMMHHEDYIANKVVNEDGTESLPNNALGHYVTISKDKKSIVPFGKIFTYRKNKRWMQEGDDLWGTGAIHLGKADEYRDPDF